MTARNYSLFANRYSLTRSQIVSEARSWIGTPYRHQASLKGAGCDCFGLIRGVWRALYGPEPEAVPAYSADWGSVQGKETLVAAARRHLVEIDPARIGPADVIVFRLRRGMVAKHCGIVTALVRSPDFAAAPSGLRPKRDAPPPAARFVHAQEHVPVCEVALSDWWRRRIVAAFAFPEAPAELPRPPHW